MRFRLRTLLIVLALGSPVIAGAWWLSTALFPQQSYGEFVFPPLPPPPDPRLILTEVDDTEASIDP